MTTRKYDGSRRTAAAERTRQAILAAAFRLHGQGILDFESLAAEADVSLPTVRKHFPTRELLFEACTSYGLHLVMLPDVERLGAEEDPAERARLAIREAYGFHESLLGQVWAAFQHVDESPALARSVQEIEMLLGLLARVVVDAWPFGKEQRAEAAGLVTGLLSPLTYRGLRVHGGMSPQQAVEHGSAAMVAALRAFARDTRVEDVGVEDVGVEVVGREAAYRANP